MIILIEGQKLFDNIQYPSMVKHLSKLGRRKELPQSDRNNYEIPQGNHHIE